MNEKTETAFIYAPRAPSAESLQDPRLSIRDATGTLLVSYCVRHRAGGIYNLQQHAWTLFNPIEPHEFVALLPDFNVRLADTPDLQTWLDAINAASPPGMRGH